MLFYAQKMPKKDLFAHASQYCTSEERKDPSMYSRKFSTMVLTVFGQSVAVY
jgi:hypothetical protein